SIDCWCPYRSHVAGWSRFRCATARRYCNRHLVRSLTNLSVGPSKYGTVSPTGNDCSQRALPSDVNDNDDYSVRVHRCLTDVLRVLSHVSDQREGVLLDDGKRAVQPVLRFWHRCQAACRRRIRRDRCSAFATSRTQWSDTRFCFTAFSY